MEHINRQDVGEEGKCEAVVDEVQCGRSHKTYSVMTKNGRHTWSYPCKFFKNDTNGHGECRPHPICVEKPWERMVDFHTPNCHALESKNNCSRFENCKWDNKRGVCHVGFNAFRGWCLNANVSKKTCKKTGCGKWVKALGVCSPKKAKTVKCSKIKDKFACLLVGCEIRGKKCAGTSFGQ